METRAETRATTHWGLRGRLTSGDSLDCEGGDIDVHLDRDRISARPHSTNETSIIRLGTFSKKQYRCLSGLLSGESDNMVIEAKIGCGTDPIP